MNKGQHTQGIVHAGLFLTDETSHHCAVKVRIFLIADAAACAVAGQTTPNGYYNIERMMKYSINKGAKVKICGSCADARGLKNVSLLEGAEISTMAELTQWVVDSDKVVTF